MSLQALLDQLPPPRRTPRLRRDVCAEIVVLGALMKGHCVRVAAIAAGFSESGVRSWVRRDPEFAAKYREAIRIGSDVYADRRRAQLLAEPSG